MDRHRELELRHRHHLENQGHRRPFATSSMHHRQGMQRQCFRCEGAQLQMLAVDHQCHCLIQLPAVLLHLQDQ